MKQRLPISSPMAKTYQYSCVAQAIILNDKKQFPWLLNSFIQLCGWKDFCIDFEDFWLVESPALTCHRYGKDLVKQGWREYLPFIKDAIDAGYYIYLCVNVSCIAAYQNLENEAHDLLIHGYDDEKQVFYAADFFDDRGFSSQCISFNEVLNAIDFSHLDSVTRAKFAHHFIFRDDILTICSCNRENLDVDLHRMMQSISNYLQGRPTVTWFTKPLKFWIPEDTELALFGIDCYQIIGNVFAFAISNVRLPAGWKRIASIFCDHKYIMYLRFCYLYAKKLLQRNVDDYEKTLLELHRMAVTGSKLLVKYDFHPSLNVLRRAQDIYQKMCEIERKLYPLLFTALSAEVGCN